MKTNYSKNLYIFGLALVTALPLMPASRAAETVVATTAADSEVTHSAADSATVPVPEYKIMPGDVLTISVANFTNLNSTVTVPPDGRISLSLINEITVTDKTIPELQADLTKRWNEYVVDPAVSVTLTQKHLDKVTVYGYVVHPGDIEFHPPVRLTQALGAAGGGLPNADLHKVVLTRANGEKSVVDLSRPDQVNGSDVDVLLGVGDLVYVPERRTEVTVVGEVRNPGSYDYKDGMTVMDALTAVGGVLNDTADLKGATLTHNGVDQPIDLYAMLRDGDMTANIKLAAGDRIAIPEARNRIYVFGAVRQPGFYLYKPKDRMLDALNGVGGPNQDADLDKVNLIRIEEGKNAASFERVDLAKFLKVGDLASNKELAPGDCLYIPTKSKGFHPEDAWVVLTGLNLLNTGARAFASGLGK
jgi:polysaccharide export outer membrane protein